MLRRSYENDSMCGNSIAVGGLRWILAVTVKKLDSYKWLIIHMDLFSYMY